MRGVWGLAWGTGVQGVDLRASTCLLLLLWPVSMRL